MAASTSETGGNCAADADAEFLSEVLAGLGSSPKTLPTRFLYDARGSELFEKITELDEYYPTRTEIGILERAAPEWAATLPTNTVLVEFGSGSSVKTELLLAATDRITTYVPMDVSLAALEDAARRLQVRFPELEIVPIEADFMSARLPESLMGRPHAAFFPGSTIGNFQPEEAVQLMTSFANIVGPGGRLMIGVDLKKDKDILERASDDSEGVTGAFNLNLLERMKRELGAELDVDGFAHLAIYNEAKSRMEMHLVSQRAQEIRICGRRFALAPDERIHTENSHKYTVHGFLELADRAGWRGEDVWVDPERLFSVHALRVA